LLLTGGTSRAQDAKDDPPLLLRKPTLSAERIVFAYAGDLWTVPRAGGDAERLTSGVGVETDPHFSPDGSQIVFTGQYDGNTDVFVIPAVGGIPKRLTHHPTSDEAVGWTPDGKHVLFRSGRDSYSGVPRLFTVSTEGGMPAPLPLPTGREGCFSADGGRFAYVPTVPWQTAWKRYRGGQTTPIWIADLKDSRILARVPRNNANDSQPIWVGDRLYFLSDRNGPVSLWSYDLKGKRVSEVVKNTELDFKNLSAGPGALVYEQFGRIFTLDTKEPNAKPRRVPIRVAADLREVRPQYLPVGNRISDAGISPTGLRAVFAARGEIFTVPADKGDARNLTNTPNVHERDPAWSPNGQFIAYFSDESGEYALHIRPQNGQGEVKKIALGEKPSYFYTPIWSPDSKKIAFSDKRLNLWYVDLAKGGPPVRLDTNPKPLFGFSPSWSPDSKWLTYARQLPSYMGAVFAYSLDQKKAYQLTDGLSDVNVAVFDKSGKYIFFTASTNTGLGVWWADMSSFERPRTRSVYVLVLAKDTPSPLLPESDEEKPKDDKPAAPAAKPEDAPTVRIDMDRIAQRILALPIPARNFNGLATGKAGILFLRDAPTVGPGPSSLSRFDLNTRKWETLLPGIGGYVVSANGEKILYTSGGGWIIGGTAGPLNPTTGRLNLSGMQAYCDPRVEWRQMYFEAWRGVRDFFYDPNLHGLPLETMKKRYEPYLAGLATRDDLNYLFDEMLGELTCSHVFNGGGDSPSVPFVRVGLLGADYEIVNGRYRFARVFDGENWNPDLRSPLAGPGVDVKTGEYLLAVNGRDVLPEREVFAYFEATAGKQITIKVGANADGSGSREVTVVPLDDESGLRYRAWVEDNRRLVDKLSGGKLAYVHIPDTSNGGYTSFNRYYFAQLDRQGAVIDERFNGGGALADYVIDYLRRPFATYFTQRDGDDFAMPTAAIFGPKVMLINEYAGSGGDYMPWAFRDAKIGPLIGTRTWGGLVGVGGFGLMDGGGIGAPQSGMWNPNGTWDVENWGVEPDIPVEWDPALWRQGKDPQLERAVAYLLEQMKKNSPKQYKKPPYPNYHRGGAPAAKRPGDSRP
jgi:tricorn protease